MDTLHKGDNDDDDDDDNNNNNNINQLYNVVIRLGFYMVLNLQPFF